jgi:hypothetical protein
MSRLFGAVIGPRLAAASLTLALAGCGGGLFVGFGEVGFFDSSPPEVSLATASSARPGDTIRLSAAAADDFGIDQVAFFRDEGIDVVLLGADGDAPYEQDTQIPLNAVGSVQYFARATDIDGNVTQSATVSVTVVP